MMAPHEIAARALAEIGTHAATPVDGASRAAALRLLLTRFSVSGKHLAEPGPSDEELSVIALAALRAPDHNKLIPFRFVVARGPALERLADLFVDYGRRRGKTGEVLELERMRAMQAPVAIAVIARIVDSDPDVPRHEQWATVGGAISNALTAAHFLGYAGKMLSGARAADPVIGRAYCKDGEELLGWISIGTATRPATPRGEIDPGRVLQFM
jgi:nitroreductase